MSDIPKEIKTTSVCALPTTSVCALPTTSVCALPTTSVCALPIRMLIFYINQKYEGFTTLYII